MDGNAPCASTNTMGFGKLFFLNSSSSCQCFSDLSIPASSERQSNAAPSVNTFIEGYWKLLVNSISRILVKRFHALQALVLINRNATSNGS